MSIAEPPRARLVTGDQLIGGSRSRVSPVGGTGTFDPVMLIVPTALSKEEGESLFVTTDEEVSLPIGGVRLAGHLTTPERVGGVVIFAHGSGSSRHSPRNRHVADFLNQARLGTLLFDLLTPTEERDRANVFDIPMLGERLTEVSQWVRSEIGPTSKVGYFGASTGAGAALWAASSQGDDIAAVVSRGGRPDLAADRLPLVKAPTLLIVGSRDATVETLNREAQSRLRAESSLEIVPGATHLFEEPGALDEVARLAREWFVEHMEGSPDEEERR